MIAQNIPITSIVTSVENNMLIVRRGDVTDSFNLNYYRIADEEVSRIDGPIQRADRAKTTTTNR